MWQSTLEKIESLFEQAIFSSRWILAPFYLGLALSLVVLLIKFIAELYHIASHAFHATENEVILGVLALVDLTLTGSLLVIVMFSGYENFVSRIDHTNHQDRPAWMGTIDFTARIMAALGYCQPSTRKTSSWTTAISASASSGSATSWREPVRASRTISTCAPDSVRRTSSNLSRRLRMSSRATT